MPKRRLTDAAVERLKPPASGQVEHFDAQLPSFGLRISHSGTKAWMVMTRVEGKLTRLTLGRYPALSLSEARRRAEEAIALAKSGLDPRKVEAERERQRERERRTTFGVVAADFLTRHVERHLRPSTAREYRRYLQGPDTASWRDRPLTTINKGDVIEVLERIEGRGSPGAANRALAYLSKFFGWAVEQDLLEVSPAARVRALSPMSARERVLTEAELAWIWHALDAEDNLFGPLFKVLLLTGQRRGEVAGMRWSELRGLEDGEAGLWEIPGARTKNKQAHLVPLPPLVLDLLRTRPRTGPFVFSSTGETPASGFGKAKARVDGRISELRQSEGLAPLPPWTLHDLRRTMVTLMNERLAIPPHVVEATINHISGSAKAGVAGVYNRALYLEERRRALTAWAEHVEVIAGRLNQPNS